METTIKQTSYTTIQMHTNKKKKLQVFISSTYEDLKEERQAAVMAILSFGHIPAGMELFAAGDESQMDVIKRWIRESDVFLLILGGRYGSIEPKSKKSYIQLEYEYAKSLGKPLFAVVIKDEAIDKKLPSSGRSVIETENPEQLKAFRKIVLSKMVKFCDEIRDIKLAIYETMLEFAERPELAGWVKSDEDVNTGRLAEEMARLGRENAMLRGQIENQKKTTLPADTLTFKEMLHLLRAERLGEPDFNPNLWEQLTGSRAKLDDRNISLLHFFYVHMDELASDGISHGDDTHYDLWKKLIGYRIIEFVSIDTDDPFRSGYGYYKLTAIGLNLYLKLTLQVKSDVYLSPDTP